MPAIFLLAEKPSKVTSFELHPMTLVVRTKLARRCTDDRCRLLDGVCMARLHIAQGLLDLFYLAPYGFIWLPMAYNALKGLGPPCSYSIGSGPSSPVAFPWTPLELSWNCFKPP